MPDHKDLTGAELHEPKGIASATSGKVYISDGLGSGVWTTLSIPDGIFTVNTRLYTSSSTWSKPADLFIVQVWCIGGGASSSNSGSDVSFGSHVSASGANKTGPVVGTGSSGDLNFSGTLPFLTSSTDTIYLGGKATSPFSNAYGMGSNESAGAGGGSAMKWIAESSLSATETVTVGGSGSPAIIVQEFILV